MADTWQWCGYPHHFVGGRDCLFSLATFVGGGRWLVSTVGDWRPDGYKQVAIGLNGDLYETMVFATDPLVLTDGEPTVIDWSGSACRRYVDAASAVDGHMDACNEYEQEARRG